MMVLGPKIDAGEGLNTQNQCSTLKTIGFSMYQMRSGALIFMLSPQVKVNVEDRYLSDSGATFAQTRTTKYIAKINVPDVIWYIDFGLLKKLGNMACATKVGRLA